MQNKNPRGPRPKIQPLYLALDQGGHASRALVFNPAGDILAQACEHIETQCPQPGRVEHDAEALVASLQSAIHKAVAQLGKQKDRLCVAGLATQRASIVCWHRDSGRALSKIISWQDRRAAEWMHRFEAEAAKIHQITGLFPSAHYGASKLRWCLDHLPEVQKAQEEDTLCFGPLASFLGARLTRSGYALADPANAARTLLWNIKTRDWDRDLLQKFGIPLKALPACVTSRYDFGHIAVSGLEIPLALMTGDQSAALFQEGPPQKNAIYINIGTGAFLQKIVGNKTLKAPRLLCSLILSEKNQQQYALEGTVNGAGAALSWFAKQNHIAPWPKAAEGWLKKSCVPPLFINGIGGLGSPFWQAKIESYFIGEGTMAARFTALIESILFLIKANLDEMNKVCKPPETLVLSGGLSASDPLCKKLADLSKVSVVRFVQNEATARGLAYLLGKIECNHAPSKRFRPQAAPELQNRYALWFQTMDALRDAVK